MNTLHFLKGSEELKKFLTSTKYYGSYNEEYDGDFTSYNEIRIGEDGKYYSIPMNVASGIYSKPKISFYHRNNKSSEPLIVTVHEVKPYEYMVIGWENV